MALDKGIKIEKFTLQHLMDDTLIRKDGNHIFPHRGSEVFQVQCFLMHSLLRIDEKGNHCSEH